MRVAKIVQPVERLFDGCIYPGFFAFPVFLGTDCYHLRKGPVSRYPETVGANGFAQRTGHLETVERNNRPHSGFDPKGIRIIAGIGHREYARRISLQQQIEINGHGCGIAISASFAQAEINKYLARHPAIRTRASAAIFSEIAAYSLAKPALVRQAAPMLRVTAQPSTSSSATSPPRDSSDRT